MKPIILVSGQWPWHFQHYFVSSKTRAGVPGKHVHTDSYSSELESFVGKDNADHLDKWVFDKVSDFFEMAEKNATMSNMLKQEKTVFFLHLLGIDTNGHKNKPMSKSFEKSAHVAHMRKYPEEYKEEISKFLDQCCDSTNKSWIN